MTILSPPITNVSASIYALTNGLYVSNDNPQEELCSRDHTQNHAPDPGYVFSTPEIVAALDTFMRTMYLKCPVIHYETFISKVSRGVHTTDKDFALLVNAIIVLQHAIQYRLDPVHGDTELRSHLRYLEICRLDFDFARAPTSDTVLVPLIFFEAHHTIGQIDRALLYLTEAIELFAKLCTKPNTIEHFRAQRLRHLLFFVEASCIASSEVSRKQLAEVPTSVDDLVPWYHSEIGMDDHGAWIGDTEIPIARLDSLATRVLCLMSKV